jgi:hypothetical protein
MDKVYVAGSSCHGSQLQSMYWMPVEPIQVAQPKVLSCIQHKRNDDHASTFQQICHTLYI